MWWADRRRRHGREGKRLVPRNRQEALRAKKRLGEGMAIASLDSSIPNIFNYSEISEPIQPVLSVRKPAVTGQPRRWRKSSSTFHTHVKQTHMKITTRGGNIGPVCVKLTVRIIRVLLRVCFGVETISIACSDWRLFIHERGCVGAKKTECGTSYVCLNGGKRRINWQNAPQINHLNQLASLPRKLHILSSAT